MSTFPVLMRKIIVIEDTVQDQLEQVENELMKTEEKLKELKAKKTELCKKKKEPVLEPA